MSDSVNEDREQRKTAGMDESNAMTVEFLRARLLSERSVSKSARQRADELAKRVTELEEQLKFVSLQRKKAEKATADVLAILENHGISDVSEESDSCSDHDKSPRDFNGSSMVQVSSMNMRPIKNDMDVYSSSEVESLPSTGRSLSWRSTKEFQHSLEKNKYMDSVRRRASFASNSLSPRRIGKSCRRIRHRELRSTDELQNDGSENAAYSVDASDSRYENGKNSPTSTTVGSNSETQKTNERDVDMERALRHQAQLIGRYEEEEKVQREWEVKFRENNSGTQDSGDPGNHSDVTEERYNMKSAELSRAAAMSNSNSQETKQELISDEKYTKAYESEFSFPMSKQKVDKDFSRKQHEASEHRSQLFLPMSQTTTHGSTKTSSYQEKIVSLPTSKRISSPLELALVPQDPSNNLEPVLEALHKAKSSLHQKLNNLPLPTNAERNKVESFQIPFGTPGLFRLPTDYQFETGIEAQPTLANSLSENIFGGFHSKPFIKPRTDFSGEMFLTAPYRPFTHEIKPGILPNRSIIQPRSNEGPSSSSIRTNNPDPYTNPVRDSYPFLPDTMLRLPLNEEGTSRTFMGSSLERSLPSVMRLSSYDEHVRPNMYR
ncbi:hypothetical protein CASFOL_006077 [Castilleja foliolosa]|uniref:Uncharacterized protein n=1 Tax=Castilleja foliolosa TaxID=1961234 RepID=A0ABD3E995_9LAMI